MATIAVGTDCQLDAEVIALMHEFRNEVFIKRLGWALPVINGRERDKYDTPDANYVIVRDDSGRITGCARLLPTTSPYMLAEQFPRLLGGGPTPRDPCTWELSRFAATVRQTREGRVLSLSQPTLDLLHSVFDCARRLGIARLILVTSIGIERLMLRAGLSAHRIGSPATVDGSLCVALVIDVSLATPEMASSGIAPRIPRGSPNLCASAREEAELCA